MKQFTLTSLFILLTPVLMIAGFVLMYLCDGSSIPLELLFPVSTLVSGYLPSVFFNHIYLLFFIAILQFPLYGLTIDLSTDKKKTAFLAAIFHIGIFIIATLNSQ